MRRPGSGVARANAVRKRIRQICWIIAEGATAPETLRQMDRTVSNTLESSASRRMFLMEYATGYSPKE